MIVSAHSAPVSHFSQRRLVSLSRGLGWAGAALCVAALVVCILAPPTGLRAWLAAAFFWSGVPIGGLLLLMMTRLIPGEWSTELALSLEASTFLMPLAGLLFLPVLVGMDALYPWAAASDHKTAFRAVYLSRSFFASRTMLWFALLGVLTVLLVRRRDQSTLVSCLGLLLFPLAATVVLTDWLMSLDPEFRSSGFGLYAMSMQATVAMAIAAIASLASSGESLRRPAVIGGLLLTVLLLWTYFSFMQYVVIWSSDLPPLISWYLRRATAGWQSVLWAFAVLQGSAIALLIFPPVQRNWRALRVIAAIILFGKALECAWLVLPEGGGFDVYAMSAFILALAGMGAMTVAGFVTAFQIRLKARTPKAESHSYG